MKTKLYAKKTLSVFMAVMMLLSAWVFVPVTAEAALAYGMSAVGSSSVNASMTLSNNGTLSIGYPKTMYIDKSEKLEDAGYYITLTATGMSGSLYLYPVCWGGQEIGSSYNTAVGLKGQTTFVDNFDNYGIAKTTGSEGWFDNVTYDSQGCTIFRCDSPSSYLNNTKYIIQGTPRATGTYTFKWSNYNTNTANPIVISVGGENKNKQWLSGVSTSGTRIDMTIVVYDKSTLNSTINSAKADYPNNSNGKYTADSFSSLQTAISNAETVLKTRETTQTNINTAVSDITTAINKLQLQKYTLEFVAKDGTVKYSQDYAYGTSVNLAGLANGISNTTEEGNENGHLTYTWGSLATSHVVTDDVTINESYKEQVAHTYGAYTQTATTHTRTCTVCGYVQTQNHTKDEGTITKTETCTEDGIKTYNCKTCGKEAIATETINNISGHNFSGDAIENVTGENGNHWRKCSRCDAYGWVMTEGACEKHNWDKNGDGQVNASDADTKASTCKEAGYEKYTCKVCNATWTKTLDLAEHKIKATAAKDVTNQCGGDGNAAFWTCSVCNKVWKDAALTDELADTTDADGDGIPDALETKGPEHEFTGAYVSASAGKDGTHYRQCARFTQCKTYGPEEKHTWGDPKVTSATCLATGKKVYTCTSGCGQTYEEPIEKLAHSMTKTDAVAAVCGKAGNNEYYHCSICDKYYKDEAGTVETTISAEVIPALTHKWTAHHEYDTLNTPANCQSAAVYNNHCDYCKVQIIGATHKYGNPDTVNGHNFSGDIVKNADGSHSYKCTVEGCTEYGNATECTYEVTEDVASTCKTAGHTTYVCTICGNGYSDTKALDVNNHTGEGTYIIDAKAPTCATLGSTGVEKCSGCDATLSTKLGDLALDPSNHEDMKEYEAKASTCQTAGWNKYTYCSACETYAVEKVDLALKAHKFTTYTSNGDGTHTATCDTCDPNVATPATDKQDCNGGVANCVDKAVCSTCGGAYGEVNSANHKASETVKKVDSTCQKEGTEAYRKCTACNTNIDTPVAIEKKAHSYGAWTQLAGEDKHTRSCTTCDAAVAEVATETEACSGGTANCVEKAKCSVCKSEYGTTDPATHKTTANTLKDAVAATCQAPGYTGDYHYNCCDAIKEEGEVIPQLEHTYSIEVEGSRKAATCIAKGEVTFKCSTCVESEGVTAATQKKELDIDAKNHASSDTRVVGKKDATCEEDGHTGDVYYVCCYDETKTAAENKKALKEKGTVIKANGQHVFGDAVPEYMAVITTDENGAMTLSAKAEEPTYAEKITYRHGDNKWYHVQQCTICDVIVYSACYTYAHSFNCVDTDTCEVCKGLCSLIDANNHKADLVEVTDGARAATCVEDGQKSYYKCADCGKPYFDEAGKYTLDLASEDDLAKLVISKTTVSHKWDEGTTTEGTCGEAGKITYKCTVGGCTETKEISTGVSSQNHTWGTEYIVITAPTCHSVGYKVIKCTICGAVKPNSAITEPATGDHDLDKNKDGTVDREDAVIVEGENCQKPGTLTYTCQNDGCEYTKTETDTQGTSQHSFGEWVTIGGDCASGVVQEQVCSKCGLKQRQTLTTDTHSLVVYVLIEATAEKPGYVIYECENCKIKTDPQPLEYNGDLPSNEHIIDATQYRTVKEATCSEAEKREYGCLLCGEKIVMYYGELKPHYWLEQPAEIATCERDGHNAYYRCVRCLAEQGRVDYKATGHADGDGDGKCDECNSAFYGDTNATCGCMCHKEGGFMKFIYKIINFFWKLFKINPACECGAKHY